MFDTNPNSKENIEDRERVVEVVKRRGESWQEDHLIKFTQTWDM